jgi:hypothetical protein
MRASIRDILAPIAFGTIVYSAAADQPLGTLAPLKGRRRGEAK